MSVEVVGTAVFCWSLSWRFLLEDCSFFSDDLFLCSALEEELRDPSLLLEELLDLLPSLSLCEASLCEWISSVPDIVVSVVASIMAARLAGAGAGESYLLS